MNQGGDIDNVEIAISSFLGHSKHKAFGVRLVCDETTRPAVELEDVVHGEQPSQQHLEPRDGGMELRHDEDEAFRIGFWIGMDGDFSLDLDQGRLIDQRLRLRVDGIDGVCVGDGSDGGDLFRLFGVVEFDVAFGIGWPLVSGSFLHRLCSSLPFLLVRRLNHAPASSPGCTSAEPDASPIFVLEFGSLHDDSDVVEVLALACYQRSSVQLL